MYYKDEITYNSQQAIRNANKEVSLPVFMTDELIESMGYLQVVDAATVPVPSAVQYLVKDSIVVTNGIPTQEYKLVDMFTDTAEYVDMHGVIVPAKTKAQHEAEYVAKLQADAQEALKEHFKDIYLGHVNTKLKVMDYDSLATVKLWEGDATFGAEATRILTWYKAIIAMNYALLTAVSNGLTTVPTDTEYQAMLDNVVF